LDDKLKYKGKEMEIKTNYKKAVFWGTVVLIIDMVVGNMLWLNPIVTGISRLYEGHPSTKSMDYFGGVGNWILLTMLFGVFLVIAFIALYLVLYKSLPGTGWRRGLFFGLMLSVIKAVPEAFNQWMLFDYPAAMIVMQLINTLLGLTIFGIVLSVIFERFNVVEKTSEAQV
jgi:hypothetical protein